MITPTVSGLAIGAFFLILISIMSLSLSSGNSNDSQRDEVVIFSGLDLNGSTHQIYTVHSDGTQLKRLTENDHLWYFEPVSSPDGSKIAYVALNSFPNLPPEGELINDLYAMNADGRNKMLLTSSHDGTIGRHVWSPDSTKIAVEGEDDIFIVDVDGTDLLRITNDNGADLLDVKPVWLSDSSKVIFTSVLLNGTDVLAASLKEVKIDGSGLRTLFDYDFDVEIGHIWSPDLNKISFIRLNDESSASLFVMNADGSNETRLAESPPLSFANRVWSPDSQRIAFEDWRGDYQDIYVIDADDGAYRNLSNSNAFDSNPRWSSDGQKIAFTRIISEEEAGIYVMNANDGSGQEQIAKMKPSILNTSLDWLSSGRPLNLVG